MRLERRGRVVGVVVLVVDIASLAMLLAVPARVAGAAQVTSPTPSSALAPVTGTGAISGVVIDATTAQPVSRAIVTLGGRGTTTRVLTDPRGRFVFLELLPSPPEGYTLTASRIGYFDAEYGSAPGQSAKKVALADGQWFADAKITMARPSSISGTVIDERGEPIVGAYVRVLSRLPIAGQLRVAAGPAVRTDDRGAYRIAGLRPGTFIVSVPSVQSAVPAETSDSVMARLTSQDVATLSAAGRPLPTAEATLDFEGGQRVVVGQYTTPPPVTGGRPQIYPTTFYGGVVGLAEAEPIELGVGQDRRTVDIQLRPVPAWRVSGVVEGPADVIAGLTLRLVRAGSEDLGQGGEAATALVGGAGRFTFVNVPTGRYRIDARRSTLEYRITSDGSGNSSTLPFVPAIRSQSGGGGVLTAAPPDTNFLFGNLDGSQAMWGRTEVEVGVSDVEHVVVPMRPTITISGRLAWERTKPVPAGTREPSVTLFVAPANGDPSLGMRSATATQGTDPRTFVVTGLLPGQYAIQMLGGGVVKSMIWNGKDYAGRAFDTSAGADITDVVITFTDQASVVQGTVQGPPDEESTVIAFPVERDRWTNYGFDPLRLRSTSTTNNATYRLQLPAGDYFLVAVPGAQPRAWVEPKFLELASGVAVRVSLGWGDEKTQALRVTSIQVRGGQ